MDTRTNLTLPHAELVIYLLVRSLILQCASPESVHIDTHVCMKILNELRASDAILTISQQLKSYSFYKLLIS